MQSLASSGYLMQGLASSGYLYTTTQPVVVAGYTFKCEFRFIITVGGSEAVQCKIVQDHPLVRYKSRFWCYPPGGSANCDEFALPSKGPTIDIPAEASQKRT
jgi:hypothetical protein